MNEWNWGYHQIAYSDRPLVKLNQCSLWLRPVKRRFGLTALQRCFEEVRGDLVGRLCHRLWTLDF